LEQLEKVLRPFFTKMLQLEPKEEENDPKLALFGPGIESPNTKQVVHNVVNSHTSLFGNMTLEWLTYRLYIQTQWALSAACRARAA